MGYTLLQKSSMSTHVSEAGPGGRLVVAEGRPLKDGGG